MLHRSAGILLSGTFDRNQPKIQPDPLVTERLINDHQVSFSAMQDPWSL
tara:strand:- start:365 stop:511 length:147 start_codon:yes stop_codon:yes gene_type:complete